jgi:nucleotidyltransferase/DNA polymerase involved in DNA repair
MADAVEDLLAQDRLWHKRDVARFCGVGTRTVENWMLHGLPHIKFGNVVRFKPQDVREFLDSRRRVIRG